MSDQQIEFNDRFAAYAAFGYFLVSSAYALVLMAGLSALESPAEPIGDPYFTILEALILILCPLLVAVFASIHVRALPGRRLFSLMALVFASLTAGVTAIVHFSILVLSRRPEMSELPGARLIFSFEWPSVVYALDILAWDVFFAVAAASAAPAIRSSRFARPAKWLFLSSAALALAGTVGAFLGDMQIRNIGVLGYVGVFTAATLMHALGLRQGPRPG